MSFPVDISVIIPTYNRAKMLPALLDSWRDLNRKTAATYELVFSDDGSTDETLTILKAVKDLPITIQANYHGGASSARNAAVKVARGKLILFLGDDIFPETNLLDEHLSLAKLHGPKVAILGRVDWHPEQKMNHLIHHITEVGNEQFSFNCLPENKFTDFRHFYTCNISIYREMLDTEAVLFDQRFYKVNFEDTELSYRLSKRGMKILYAPSAHGLHYHEYDVEKFCNRQKTAGEMAIVFRDLHPEVDDIFNFGIIEKQYDKYVEEHGLQTFATSKISLTIQRTKEYEEEIAAEGPNSQLKRDILSVIYRQLFNLKFSEGLLECRHNYQRETAENFLYSKYFGEEFFRELDLCGGYFTSLNGQYVSEEKTRNMDLLSNDAKDKLSRERPSNLSYFLSIDGLKRILKRSSFARKVYERLYGAKVQSFSEIESNSGEDHSISLAVLVDKINSNLTQTDFVEIFGLSIRVIEGFGSRIVDQSGGVVAKNGPATYDYIYDLRGGKESIRSSHMKNLALALSYRAYDALILSYSYGPTDLIGVVEGYSQLVISSDLHAALDTSANCNSVSQGPTKVPTGRVVRLLPAPGVVHSKNIKDVFEDCKSISVAQAGFFRMGPGRCIDAPLRQEPGHQADLQTLMFEKPVIFVITIFMAVGGAERNIIEVMRALRNKYTFVIITTERHSNELGSLHHQVLDFSDDIYDLGELSSQDDFMNLMERLNTTYRPGALLVTNGSPWFLANSNNIRKLFKDIPIIDHQVYDQNAGWINHYLDPGIQSFDYFVAINKKIETVMQTEKQIPDYKIRQIYHTVNVDRIIEYKNSPISREEILHNHAIPSKKKIYIMIARLSDQKRPTRFLKLAALRKHVDTNEHFVLIGDGPLHSKVENFIRRRKLENVTWITYVDNPVPLISTAEAMIFTSIYEGLPVAMLEAMSLGVPVLSTDVGDIATILREYDAGVTFPPNAKVRQYDEFFSDFVASREKYAANLIVSKDKIIDRFCPTTIAEQYDELLSNCLDEKHSE